MRVTMLVRCLAMMRGGGETRHLAWARELRALGVDVDIIAGQPWLFDRPLAAGFDLFNTRRILPDYTVESLGGDIRLGHPLGEYSRINAVYRVSQDRISDVNQLGSPQLISQEGTHLTSLVGVNQRSS